MARALCILVLLCFASCCAENSKTVRHLKELQVEEDMLMWLKSQENWVRYFIVEFVLYALPMIVPSVFKNGMKPNFSPFNSTLGAIKTSEFGRPALQTPKLQIWKRNPFPASQRHWEPGEEAPRPGCPEGSAASAWLQDVFLEILDFLLTSMRWDELCVCLCKCDILSHTQAPVQQRMPRFLLINSMKKKMSAASLMVPIYLLGRLENQ